MTKSYHFIGIGGIGMSALARILLERGAKISGSDLCLTPVMEEFRKAGASIFVGHRAEQVGQYSSVVYSGIIRKDNPEMQRALELGYPLLHRSDLLKELMEGYRPLLVTGTHGKTTTSSLLTHVLKEAGLDPCFAIGGVLSNFGTNGRHGKGDCFVAEADESDGSFLRYPCFGAIITNVEEDHMNYWKTRENLIEGFSRFAEKAASSEHLFWCSDDPVLSSLHLKGTGYGFGEPSVLRAENVRELQWNCVFDLSFEEKKVYNIELSLPGRHNVLNALAVFGLAARLGIEESLIRRAFRSFKGVRRRLEKRGEWKKMMVFDDYGHHPTEIKATIKAIKKSIGAQRLVVAFQPHRYTRTQDLFHEFVTAFEGADLLILTDIYSAEEAPISGITGKSLFFAIQKKTDIQSLFFSRKTLEKKLASILRPDDFLLTLGAGDITYAGPGILDIMRALG